MPEWGISLIIVAALLLLSAFGAVALWRLDETEEGGRRAVHFKGHTGAVVALQGDGDKVVSAARDDTEASDATEPRAAGGPFEHDCRM